MIAKLRGILDTIYPTHVVIDVGGVGYSLLCSAYTLQKLPSMGEKTVLFVEPLIRQENITLYGFLTEEERELFRLLLTVQGVGGKVCLSLLSGVSPDVIQNCLITQDHTPLTQADGVGPKLALRIVRELKGKSFSNTLSALPTAQSTSGSSQEAVSALVNLGYKKHEVLMVVEKILNHNPDSTLQMLISQSLQHLGKING